MENIEEIKSNLKKALNLIIEVNSMLDGLYIKHRAELIRRNCLNPPSVINQL